VEALVEALMLGAERKPPRGDTLPTFRQRVMLGIGG